MVLKVTFSNSCSIFTLLNPCEKKSIINVWISLFSVVDWSITQLCLNPWVRYIESNTGESTRQGNLRHPRARFQSFSLRGLPSQRTIVILPKGVGDFPILYFFRCLILFLTKPPNCFCLHSIERFPAIYFSIAEVNIRFIHMQPYFGSISS